MIIRNAKIITPDDVVFGHCLIKNGVIEKITVGNAEENAEENREDFESVEWFDAEGDYLAPGLIDLQLNGAFGHDFTHAPESIWAVAAELPKYGLTSFLPTIITSPLATSSAAQKVLANRPVGWRGAEPLGLHIEGPFLNPAKKGAHNANYILEPSSITSANLADWNVENGVRLVTLAPEMPGAIPMIKQLVGQGVIVSAGHSAATMAEAKAGFQAGISYITHLFNAMPPLHHREPGLVGAALADESITIGLIPDGVHVHPDLVRLVWQLASHRINGVTDAMGAMGMPPGDYALGDYTVHVSATEARLASGTLAGSIVLPIQVIQNLVLFTDCKLEDAIGSMTTVPADILGIGGRKGRIAPGFDADLILFDEAFNIKKTIIGGKINYDC
ncbi:MAG: N-acetylglucosamine-6-phosphate deacetylase [Cellvibrionaceae bacterium]|jgi:N-acetylglucosamine-6-phosphate deacetylase